MLDVAAFTGGRSVPSARFRVRQYGPALAGLGVHLREFVAPVGKYPPARRWLRPAWGAAALATNVPRVARSWRSDVTLLQRELLSTLVTLEPFTRSPRILDVDDAIFLHRGGQTARRLAELCDAVVCGNTFLAQWFGEWNRAVHIVPTAVDTDAYIPLARSPSDGEVILGWIGTSGNLRYLRGIEGALAAVMGAFPRARLRVVSDARPFLPGLPADRVDFVRWTQGGEISDIQRMDVGIMPLEDSLWTRGKCSFKMLQYMACGLPVVVSPVGMNAEVLALGHCGLGPASEAAWIEALAYLIGSGSERAALGAEGRRIAESTFSIHVVAPRLARCLAGR